MALTAPYMHDGSLTTLEEVIDFYDVGGRPNPNLSPLIRPLFLNGFKKWPWWLLHSLTGRRYKAPAPQATQRVLPRILIGLPLKRVSRW